MSGNPGRVLVVSEVKPDRNAICHAFRTAGWDMIVTDHHEEAVVYVDIGTFDLLVVDLPSGLNLVERIRKEHPVLPIVVLSECKEVASAVESVQRGATSYLTKPTSLDAIVDAVARAERIRRTVPDSLDESMRAHIRRVLADCQFNKSEAAKRLGIDRRSLQRKIAKLNL